MISIFIFGSLLLVNFELIGSSVQFESVNNQMVESNLTLSFNHSNYNLTHSCFRLYPLDKWKSLGMVDERIINLINPHWFEYPPPSTSSHYIFALVYSIQTFVSVLGNGLVLCMILSCKTLRTASNILVLNLALSDMIMLLKGPIFVLNSIYLGPVLGYIGCQLYGFVGGLSGTCSIMTLAAISLDRFKVIAHPLELGQRKTKIRSILWIIFIWLYSCLFASFPLIGSSFGVKPYSPEGFLTSCSFDYLNSDRPNRIFIFSYFIAAWCIPFVLIFISYSGICWHVLHVRIAWRGQERARRRRETRVAVIVIFVIALWFVSWTPYAIVALLGITGHQNLLSPMISMVPAVFCKTAACLDPFVYSLNHPRFRQQLLKVLMRDRYNIQRAQSNKTSWKMEESISLKHVQKSN